MATYVCRQCTAGCHLDMGYSHLEVNVNHCPYTGNESAIWLLEIEVDIRIAHETVPKTTDVNPYEINMMEEK